jgi:hypothetical protein
MSPSMKARFRRTLDRWTRPGTAERTLAHVIELHNLTSMMAWEQARTTPRFQDEKRLLRYGGKVWSQNDEDGMIAEIFRRVGTTNREFVEFGAGDGSENLTLYSLAAGWSGTWIDGSAACYEAVQSGMRPFIREGRLRMKYSFITADNIEDLFRELGVPAEPDLLVIDIDRNDYWVWRAITHYRPRVVCIEYNGSWGPSLNCVVPYEPTAIWAYNNYYGASLKALEILGAKKGYCLVGCNWTGVNAFFVREDLVNGDLFAEPFTSENHYEPPRYYCRFPGGHAPAFGPVVTDAGVESEERVRERAHG